MEVSGRHAPAALSPRKYSWYPLNKGQGGPQSRPGYVWIFMILISLCKAQLASVVSNLQCPVSDVSQIAPTVRHSVRSLTWLNSPRQWDTVSGPWCVSIRPDSETQCPVPDVTQIASAVTSHQCVIIRINYVPWACLGYEIPLFSEEKKALICTSHAHVSHTVIPSAVQPHSRTVHFKNLPVKCQ